MLPSERMPKSRLVALLIDTSTSWGIRLIKGINQYAHESGDWLIHVEPRGRYERRSGSAGNLGGVASGLGARRGPLCAPLPRILKIFSIPCAACTYVNFGPGIASRLRPQT